jgi:hypothetical protein
VLMTPVIEHNGLVIDPIGGFQQDKIQGSSVSLHPEVVVICRGDLCLD